MSVTLDKNFDAIQGDAFILDVNYTDDQNNPIDLTGKTVRIEVRDKPGGKIVAAVGTIGDGIEVATPTNGHIRIALPPVKTRKFVVPRSAYQVQVTGTDGLSTTILKGWLIVDAGVID